MAMRDEGSREWQRATDMQATKDAWLEGKNYFKITFLIRTATCATAVVSFQATPRRNCVLDRIGRLTERTWENRSS